MVPPSYSCPQKAALLSCILLLANNNNNNNNNVCGFESSLSAALLHRRKQQHQQQQSEDERRRSSLALNWMTPRLWTSSDDTEPPPCRRPCENPFDNDKEDNEDLDRREALFAMMGSLWAVGLLPGVDPAFAVRGDDANIQLPNPYKAMTDRANKQCLVESLGTRECLVYMDEANKLYQGADALRLLARVEKASSALSQIPTYIQAKKWSQVTGVLTGPMGELVRTMGQLAGNAGGNSHNDDAASAVLSDKKKKKIQAFKTDIYAIAAAVDRRDMTLALKTHKAATQSLADFVKSL